MLINWKCRCVFVELVQKTVFFQQLLKEMSALCLLCGKKNLLLQTEDCSKGLALAHRPSLPAGIDGVANYSAEVFHCRFPSGFWIFFLCSQDILHSQPCILLSCWVFTALRIKMGSLWWQSRSQRIIGRQNRPRFCSFRCR